MLEEIIICLTCFINHYILAIVVFILFAVIITKLFCEKSNLEIILDGLKNFNKDQGFILIIIVFIIYTFQEDNVWLRGLSIILIIGLSAYLIKQRSDVDKVSDINKKLTQEEASVADDKKKSILGEDDD